MKNLSLLLTCLLVFSIFSSTISAQNFDRTFSVIKKRVVTQGFTFMREVTREGKNNPGMIIENTGCLAYKELYMVGVFLHEPKAPHTVVSIGVPGTTQSARSEFSAPVKETDSKGETVYTVEADIRFSSAGPDCKMDIYCYEKDFANYPAYLLIFQKN